jgi:pimeloyl-ACP methyl ester carboxylesterase
MVNGQTFVDGLISYLAADASFTLDQLAALNQADPNGILTGRLDLERAGVFGVSLGGMVVGETCRVEPRLRACMVLDAHMTPDVVRDGLRQPTMWISRDVETLELDGWPHAGVLGIDALYNGMRAVFERLPGDGYVVLVPGTFHLNFTDTPYYSPLTSLVRLAGPINAQRAHTIINAYTLAFFDRHLKGLPAPLLDGPAEQYPEVLYEMHHPIPT